ncbi:DNA-binding transcriptional LysR family regulator [Buttiauxella sp. JUb87]|uniref:LysR family transcriptional regulator n=1 Tax=Buttiauxella sp. JUb87 TaxID=2485129 RepID=UPI00105C9330|nr:LysR family transcriptional regulator [Buttiauxella sp. JUb87]TDN54432.1 DNA-binding transcriptional LysR family regulator [Buttiauxella sp. JUb87]
MNDAIDLRQLRYFLAVSEELNFSRAALRLHISQPPLSRQIRQLEEQLGVQLFLRSKTGVTLTEAGAAFLPEVKLTLLQAEKAIAVARASKGQDGGRFVIGYTTVFERSIIPNVTIELTQRFPDWQILSKGNYSVNLIREVQNGTMDAAFVGLHSDTQDLAVEKIINDPLVVAIPQHHRLAAKRSLSFDDLRGEAIFWFERRMNPGFYDHCQAFFQRINFKLNLIPEPADHHIMLGLIAEGNGIALVPASLQCIKRQGVVFRKLREESHHLTMGIAVVWSRENQSPVLKTFLEQVHCSPEPRSKKKTPF